MRSVLRHGAINLVVACLVVVGAVNAAATTTPSPSVPPGYHTVTVRKAGMSILLPDEWVIYKQTRKDLEALLEVNPELGDIEDLLDNAQRTPLRAFYNVGADGASEASLSVEWQPGVRLLRTPRMAKAEFEQSGVFEDVEAHQARVAGKRAVRVEGTLSLTAPSGEQVAARETIYFVLTDRGLLAIGFVERAGTEHHETFDTMIRSVSLVRKG